MRKQFIKTVSDIFKDDKKTALLLGDIGVFGFRQLFKEYPERVFNVGILEQAMIGMASGLSLKSITPIVHTIAPFLVERAYEQLKIDFGYQKINGNFVSIGSSYDYASLGSTHHCPADVNILRQIPNMEIIVAGHSDEFDKLFRYCYKDGYPTYYRLSDYENKESQDVRFGKANIIKNGKKATVIAVGNLLDKVVKACEDKDVTILYYTTIVPFDFETLRDRCSQENHKILLCEPYYLGGLTSDIMENINKPIQIKQISMPIKFLTNYGSKDEHDEALGFTVENIRNRLENLLNE